MANLVQLLFHLLCFCLWFQPGVKSRCTGGNDPNEIPAETKTLVHVGLILDLNSPVGATADSYISMAISDFYAAHSDYRTRLLLHTRDSKDAVDAAFAALDLLKVEEVEAIIGPQTSMQGQFVINLGEEAQVPIISFSASSPSLSAIQTPFFIRTALDDSSQVKAIESIVQAYRWREVVLIYEDTEYGRGLIPYLADAFQLFNIRITYRWAISQSASGFKISKKLNMLMARQTRVFLVHVTGSLGSKLFSLAKQAGMMSKGYAWIITDGLSSLLNPMAEKFIDLMEGVLGVRPHLPASRRLANFKMKWKIINSSFYSEESSRNATKLNLFSLWAYDTVWALAMAAESVYGENQNLPLKQNSSECTSQSSAFRVSEMGPRLRNILLHNRFNGLSGDFHLVNGQLQSSAFEIINVVDKEERIIGYWNPENRKLSRKLGKSSEKTNSTSSTDELEPPIWPGYTKDIPKGWEIPVSGEKLRIGVPMKSGFKEYMKVEWHPYTEEPIISGFSHDVFLAALEELPFPLPHKFIPFVNSSRQSRGTYNELLCSIKLQEFDAVVGDTTIIANRSSYVDFTLPYFKSDVVMIVKIKDDQRRNIWIFLKPLSWDLWLTICLAFTFTGLVVWVLEHRINREFRGPPEQQVGVIFWFSFSTIVFAHRERVVNNFSRIVLIIWIFVVLILTQSYTASLASMLTVQRLQPAVVDVEELKRNGDFVGYETGSFVKDLLLNQLHFEESKLRHYSSPEDLHKALSKGSQNSGVTAIFGPQHCMNLFLAKYCNQYMTAGPSYKTDGLGFAFPRGSPLVSYMSRAILNVTENKARMDAIDRKYFAEKNACEDQQTAIYSDSLSVYSFGGLFIITGVASMSSLVIYVSKFLYSHWSALDTPLQERSLWSKITELAKHFDSRIHPVPTLQSTGASSDFENTHQN